MKKLFGVSLGTAALVLTGFTFLLFGSCRQKPADGRADGNSGAAAKPKEIICGVANDFIPYAYLDEKENLVGYEIELLQEVDRLLPQYEFKLEPQSDQWIALNSGRVELITHQWEKNAEREKTYLFGKEMLTSYDSYIAFKPGRTDLNKAEDMYGKKIQVGQSSGAAIFLEAWNAAHGNRVEIVYSSGGTEITLSKLDTGAIDGYLQTKRMIETTEKNYNVTLGKSADSVYSVYTYFVFRKDEPDEQILSDAIDGVLKTLRAQGFMRELSLKWLGGSYADWGPEHVAD